MVGTVSDGQLTRPVTPPRSRARFAVANREHEAAIRRLLRENPMRGAISLTLEREPDYFGGADIAGASDQTIVAFEDERLVCMGRCTTRTVWINGQIRRAGYLAELRLDASVRGRFDLVRDGYRFFQRLQETTPADVYFTSIAADNERARRLLERGVSGLPRYAHSGDLTTLLISTRRSLLERMKDALSRNEAIEVERLDPKPLHVRAAGLKRVEVNSLHRSAGSFWQPKRNSTALSQLSSGAEPMASDVCIQSGRDAAAAELDQNAERAPRPNSNRILSSASAEELAEVFNSDGARNHLAATWTPTALESLARHDLPSPSFGVIRDGAEIVAAAGLWDQRRFRQTVMRRYSRGLGCARPLINLAAKLLGVPPLPRAGGVLSHAFLSPLAIHAGYETWLIDLVAAFRRRAAARGIDYLTLALPSADYRLALLQRRFRCRAYASRIYRVQWPDQPEFALDARPILPDVALL